MLLVILNNIALTSFNIASMFAEQMDSMDVDSSTDGMAVFVLY